LLCKTLERFGEFGHPEEYFHRHTLKQLKLDNHPEEFLAYCHSIYQQDPSEPFGIKMHWWQLLDFLRLARQSSQFKDQSDGEILNTLFPNLTFIYLWRRDMASQAVSAAIASQTGQWEKSHPSGQKPSKTTPIKFQPWKIYEWETSLNDQNLCWQKFFQENHLNYYEITYEDLVESFPQEIAKVISHIGNHIDVEPEQLITQLEMPTQRQSNATNRRFISYYALIPKPLLRVLYQLYRQLKPIPSGGGS
ncbi:MAG: Stf0 sulfotransferase family protein, partial [Leptolyngbyaceae cyanobacterium MAG.088]|nr:Stf0 sulfotransferase family protein [Leptolyngbyaceae cyanobacterium MAG.088]